MRVRTRRFEKLRSCESRESKVVEVFDGKDAIQACSTKYPAIRKKLWGDALWSPSYFAGSCGGAPIAVIRQYIEKQRTTH